MNLKELRTEVNKDIDDQLNNADINGWINRALDDLSQFARYKKKVTINVVNGVSDYLLPTDLLDVLIVGQNVPVLSLNDFTSNGYKLVGDTLTLQPVPTESYTMDVIYIAPLPHVSNDDDVPAIPTNFHNLLVLYAVAKAKYADEEESMQMNAMNEYQSRKQDFIRFMNRKEPPMSIRDVYNVWQSY